MLPRVDIFSLGCSRHCISGEIKMKDEMDGKEKVFLL